MNCDRELWLYNVRRCDPSLIGTRTGFGMGGLVFVDQKWSRVHFWHAKSGPVGPLFAGTTFGMTGTLLNWSSSGLCGWGGGGGGGGGLIFMLQLFVMMVRVNLVGNIATWWIEPQLPNQWVRDYYVGLHSINHETNSTQAVDTDFVTIVLCSVESQGFMDTRKVWERSLKLHYLAA